ncbi:hypothetical protein [Streptomyces sp. NPDC002156]
MDSLIPSTAAGEAGRPARRQPRQAAATADHEPSPVPLLAGADDSDPAESHIIRGID